MALEGADFVCCHLKYILEIVIKTTASKSEDQTVIYELAIQVAVIFLDYQGNFTRLSLLFLATR